jgi:hypothetical protein
MRVNADNENLFCKEGILKKILITSSGLFYNEHFEKIKQTKKTHCKSFYLFNTFINLILFHIYIPYLITFNSTNLLIFNIISYNK